MFIYRRWTTGSNNLNTMVMGVRYFFGEFFQLYDIWHIYLISCYSNPVDSESQKVRLDDRCVDRASLVVLSVAEVASYLPLVSITLKGVTKDGGKISHTSIHKRLEQNGMKEWHKNRKKMLKCDLKE